jgi:uncharacterized Fe-S center protein
MATSTVYFYSNASNLRAGAAECFKLIAGDFGKEEAVGLKVHFGELGNNTHINPEWLADAKTFFPQAAFVECNVLYRGSRTVRKDHVATAAKHGFNFLPIDILDGERGESQVEVPVNIGSTKKAKLGAGLMKYKKLIAVTHFKGHMAAGFGGALKNIGMGLGCRAGKMDMHSIISPVIKKDKCVACGTCVKDCPVNAITLGDVASIDSGKCIGCAHCIAVCPQAAIDLNWASSGSVSKLMEKIAEYAHASMDGRRWWFINFITDITYDCDCFGIEQKPFMPNIGIISSQDPVAADQASLDLVKKRNRGTDPFLKKHHIDGTYLLDYAEKIGLGKKQYTLQEL